jgi:pimeloyl-ACP methyl ester carboxylesterase
MKRTEEATVSRVLSRDGTVIGSFTSGQGPPLVLVHGGLGDHTRWRALLPYLEPHVTVHALDRRGRGASGDALEHALEREYEDVAAVVDDVAERTGDAVDLLGNSYGGVCALGAAALTLNVRRLVLFEGWPPPDLEAVAPPLALADRLDSLLRADDRDGLLVEAYRAILGFSDEEIAAFRTRPEWRNRLAAAHTVPREIRAIRTIAFDPHALAGIDVPTLLLAGSESRGWAQGAPAVAAALPEARLAILPGQGHAADIVVPERFAEPVLAFLRED